MNFTFLFRKLATNIVKQKNEEIFYKKNALGGDIAWQMKKNSFDIRHRYQYIDIDTILLRNTFTQLTQIVVNLNFSSI